MLYLKTMYQDSNQNQALATYGKPYKDLEKAAARAKSLSIQRGVAEVVDQGNHLLAAFRAGQALPGSVLI